MDILSIVEVSLIKTITLVPHTLLIIIICLLGADILIQLGVMQKLEPVGRPLAKWAHLPPESALSFITAFGSVLAANTMVANFYKNKKINHIEMILSLLFISGPGYIREVVMFHIPIVFPLMGMQVALVYLITFGLIALTNLILAVWGGRMLLPIRDIGISEEKECRQQVTFTRALKNSWSRQKQYLRKIILTFVLMTFLVSFFSDLGVFKSIEPWVEPLTKSLELPAVVIAPLSAHLASPLVGMSALSTLLQNGVITNYQGIITVLLGAILMLPIFAIRNRLPNNTAIFGFRYGLLITIIFISIAIIIHILVLVMFLNI